MSTDPAARGEPLNPEHVRALADYYIAQGFDCAETMVRVFERLGLLNHIDSQTLFALASGFGKGIGKTRGDCGALSGAVLVINAVFASKRKTGKHMYKITGAFAELFLDKFGSLTCTELRIKDDDCKERTRRTAELLAEFLQKRMRG